MLFTSIYLRLIIWQTFASLKLNKRLSMSLMPEDVVRTTPIEAMLPKSLYCATSSRWAVFDEDEFAAGLSVGKRKFYSVIFDYVFNYNGVEEVKSGICIRSQKIWTKFCIKMIIIFLLFIFFLLLEFYIHLISWITISSSSLEYYYIKSSIK